MLKVENLNVTINTEKGPLKVVRDLSFKLEKGKVLGLVGESGAGKTMAALSIIGLNRLACKISGKVFFKGADVLDNAAGFRGRHVALIMQSSDEALNPALTIGQQLDECFSGRQSSVALLRHVGIPDAERRLESYPHQLSGGMKQRVAIAMALALQPEIIIADEPTSGLDLTVQAQIIELLKELVQERRIGLILITHDLGIVARLCDEVLIMYAGRIVESGSADHVYYHAVHPYTKGLLNCIGRFKGERRQRLRPVKGLPPDLYLLDGGCSFAERCQQSDEVCLKKIPALRSIDGHRWACHVEDSC